MHKRLLSSSRVPGPGLGSVDTADSQSCSYKPVMYSAAPDLTHQAALCRRGPPPHAHECREELCTSDKGNDVTDVTFSTKDSVTQ